MTPIAITVFVPTAGDRPDLLKKLLDSLCECKKPLGYRATVVIENGPSRRATALVEGYKKSLNTQYIHHPVANKSAALNAALNSTETDLAVFFDDDVIIDEQTLEAYADAAAATQNRNVHFGGPFRCYYEKKPPAWLLPHLPYSAKGWQPDASSTPSERDYFLGCNWAVYADTINALGGFDPNYGPGSPIGARGQEFEMQERLRTINNTPVIVQRASVCHFVPINRSTFRWLCHRVYKSTDIRMLGMSANGSVHLSARVRLVTLYSAKALRMMLLGALTASRYRLVRATLWWYRAYRCAVG